MANRFSLSASVVPSIDEQAAERSGRDLAQTLEQEIGDLTPDIGGAGGGGLGGIGGARAGGLGGGGGVLGSLASAASGGGALTVALGGAIGFGLLQGVQAFASASPALQQTFGILSDAFEIFFRPFGKALDSAIRPFALAARDMALRFMKISDSEGIGVALLTVGAEAAASIGTGFVNALGNIASGEGTLADFLFAGAGTIAITKLLTGASITSLLTSSSIGGLLTSSSIGGLLTSVSIGGLLTTVAAGGLFTAVAASAVFTSVAISKLIHGELEMPSGEEPASTVGGDPFDPEEEQQFREAVQQTNTTATPSGTPPVDTSQPPRNGTRNGVVYQNGVAVGTTEELELMREIARNTSDDDLEGVNRSSATDPATQRGGAEFDPF